ncbi:MAG TPA: carcinine hydrolase/isopenicillin-N N-acyltransferase family protein, partial [Candidatus Hydrogenedentes bacterium]|nr:carcinine hydrolase/isopenicillin-N N-acyltransferase family protein [Candidatus Hydrogenedentota bacterium]
PDGYVPFASVGYIGTVGVLSGMNMEGISISQIGAINEDKRLSGTPLGFVLRRFLEETHDLDEATALIQSVRRTVGYNYVVADGDAQDARAYETCAHHCVVFGPNDPNETVEYALPTEDAVFRSDEAMDPTVRSLQHCAKAPDLPYGSNSYDHRYKGMAMRIREQFGAIDQPAALEILRAVAMRGVNLHSVLYSSTDREMWVAHATDSEDAWTQPYAHYALKSLFKRPEERAQ